MNRIPLVANPAFAGMARHEPTSNAVAPATPPPKRPAKRHGGQDEAGNPECAACGECHPDAVRLMSTYGDCGKVVFQAHQDPLLPTIDSRSSSSGTWLMPMRPFCGRSTSAMRVMTMPMRMGKTYWLNAERGPMAPLP